MKIVFVTPNFHPHVGGVERHVKEVAEALCRDGHLPIVVTVKHENDYADREEIAGVSVIRMGRPDRGRLPPRAQIRLALIRHLGLFRAADVVHFHDFSTLWGWGLALYPLLRILGKRTYLTFHGWEGVAPPPRSIVILRKLCENMVHGNICIGHYIERWYGTRADLVSYGGVHALPLDRRYEVEDDMVLFLGRLEPDTGICQCMDAWPEIQRRHPGLQLRVCGDGSLRRTLEDHARDHLEAIRFEGAVADVVPLVARARLVFTSGYLGILEALAQKKAVVATYDNPLKRDYLRLMPGSESMFWMAGNSQEIVASACEALTDRTRAEAGYRFALANSWEQVKEDYYRLWRWPSRGGP